ILSPRASSAACFPPLRRRNHGCRFEGIPETELQAFEACNLESLHSQVARSAEKRLCLSALGVVHGRRLSSRRTQASRSVFHDAKAVIFRERDLYALQSRRG